MLPRYGVSIGACRRHQASVCCRPPGSWVKAGEEVHLRDKDFKQTDTPVDTFKKRFPHRCRHPCKATQFDGVFVFTLAALLHKHNRTALQLYHGSTGAIMFRSGPSSTAVGRSDFPSLSAASFVADVHCEEIDAGHRRVCWLGWDGSTKEGIDGRQDFSEWLCPEVFFMSSLPALSTFT